MRENISQEIIDAFNKGNKDAFEKLYNNLFVVIYSLVKKFPLSNEEAEDICADTFLKLWGLRGKFENPGKLINFLIITAKNASLDFVKHQKIVAIHQQKILPSMLVQQGDDKEPDWITLILLQNIQEEIEKLPTQCRTVFKLAYIDGLKNQEIGQVLNLREKTVRNQKAKALKKLRLFVRNNFDSGFGR